MQATRGSAVNTNIIIVLLGVFYFFLVGVGIFLRCKKKSLQKNIAQAIKKSKALDEEIAKTTRETDALILEQAQMSTILYNTKTKPGYREYTH